MTQVGPRFKSVYFKGKADFQKKFAEYFSKPEKTKRVNIKPF